MASGSIRAVFYSLGANAAIAVAKYVAAFVTGSHSMVAEAVHSTADCGNQLLLFGVLLIVVAVLVAIEVKALLVDEINRVEAAMRERFPQVAVGVFLARCAMKAIGKNYRCTFA